MARTSTTDPLVGDVLDGRYEVLQRLARGGMATVYRAWDRRLERIVAIKVMHEGLGDDADFSAKFDREARAAARLCDQNVVTIFDQGHDHGRPYIVMEFVEGPTLRSVISREAPLSPLRAIQLIESVAAALAVAHDSGLVHRDVKPENVLISDRGKVKVADFGLARTVTAQTATKSQGLLIGTVSYLPPELLTTGSASAASDIYSTGIMLFEMLTGSKPYTGEAPITVAYKHVNEDVPPPSVVLARNHPAQARREPIPDYLDALVTACTRRNQQGRPVDGRDLLNRVRKVRRGLERGIRSDEALATLVFPAAALGWATEPTEVISAQPAATPAVVEAAREPVPLPAREPMPVHQPTPVEVEVAPRPISAAAPRVSQAPIHRRRRTALVAILVLLLALGVGTSSWWFTSGRYIATPAVVNQTRDEASALAEANGLTISFTEEYSETVPKDLIISSAPGPGERIIRNSQMHAVISLGPERFLVPELVGLPIEEAKAALAAVNLLPGQITEAWDEQRPVGVVVTAGYNPGEPLKRDSPVDLVVSKGREPLTIPNVVNMGVAEASKMLTESGFQVAIGEEKHDDKVPKQTVISQQPANGTGHRGDTITLVVSLGPELIVVPDVTDKRQDEATRILQDAGFKVRVVRTSPFQLTVKSTDPPAGTEAPKGSDITLTMG